MALRVAEARRRVLVFMAQHPDDLLGEAAARELRTNLRVVRAELEQLVGHMMQAGVLSYEGPGAFDVKITQAGLDEVGA